MFYIRIETFDDCIHVASVRSKTDAMDLAIRLATPRRRIVVWNPAGRIVFDSMVD